MSIVVTRSKRARLSNTSDSEAYDMDDENVDVNEEEEEEEEWEQLPPEMLDLTDSQAVEDDSVTCDAASAIKAAASASSAAVAAASASPASAGSPSRRAVCAICSRTVAGDMEVHAQICFAELMQKQQQQHQHPVNVAALKPIAPSSPPAASPAARVSSPIVLSASPEQPKANGKSEAIPAAAAPAAAVAAVAVPAGVVLEIDDDDDDDPHHHKMYDHDFDMSMESPELHFASVPASAAAAGAAASSATAAASSSAASAAPAAAAAASNLNNDRDSSPSVEFAALQDAHDFEEIIDKCAALVQQAHDACTCGINGGGGGRDDGLSNNNSSSSPHVLLPKVDDLLRQLKMSYHKTTARYEAHLESVRLQRDRQAEEFVSVRLQLEEKAAGRAHERADELSRIRIEEMMAREKETAEIKKAAEKQEQQWLAERLRVEEEAAREVARLKKQAESVAEQMKALSSNAHLMDGEAAAIETGEGEMKIIELRPSDTFEGHTPGEFHFRLAESQFLRLLGSSGMAAFHVTKVDYILNPALLKRFHDFKKGLEAKGEKVETRLTFHGTTETAIKAICKEGFRIGGVDTPMLCAAALGQGIYSSEEPSFAMRYIKDGKHVMLFTRAIPTKDSVISLGPGGVIQQLVCKNRDQIIPTYVVHYAPGARKHDAPKVGAAFNPAAAMAAIGAMGGGTAVRGRGRSRGRAAASTAAQRAAIAAQVMPPSNQYSFLTSMAGYFGGAPAPAPSSVVAAAGVQPAAAAAGVVAATAAPSLAPGVFAPSAATTSTQAKAAADAKATSAALQVASRKRKANAGQGLPSMLSSPVNFMPAPVAAFAAPALSPARAAAAAPGAAAYLSPYSAAPFRSLPPPTPPAAPAAPAVLRRMSLRSSSPSNVSPSSSSRSAGLGVAVLNSGGGGAAVPAVPAGGVGSVGSGAESPLNERDLARVDLDYDLDEALRQSRLAAAAAGVGV